ncbi:hypothetical protein LV564_06790 [Komagataeibacter nataicola]|nr:hypothetical protein [Komagataeibacter nataicola]WEQ56776.1 hypothetical protein LV564_06790 [Komagataeibacter nataicola]
MPGHPPAPGPYRPVAHDALAPDMRLLQPVVPMAQSHLLRPQPDGMYIGMRLLPRFVMLLACVASLAACADHNPRVDDNARAASDHGNGGPQGEWGSLGGGWSGPGNMGW